MPRPGGERANRSLPSGSRHAGFSTPFNALRRVDPGDLPQPLGPDALAVVAERLARVAVGLVRARAALAASARPCSIGSGSCSSKFSRRPKRVAADVQRVLRRRPGRPSPTSLWYGRAQPFGQPVMRTLIALARPAPARRTPSPSWSTTPGSARSLSVMASGHVGMAGQAMLHFCTSDRFSGRGMPYSVSSESTAGLSAVADVAEQHVLLARERGRRRRSGSTIARSAAPQPHRRPRP